MPSDVLSPPIVDSRDASVSAVIPVFNRFEYLGECLESVYGQTQVPDEVLVVDDCSSKSVEEYLAKTPFRDRVRILRTDRNRRVSGARNWGWKHARNRLIAFLDSDDVWEPFKIEHQVLQLQSNPEAAGVYGAMTAFYPDGTAHPWGHDRPPRVTVATALAHCNISVQTLLIKRSALEKIGGFDEGFGILDDQELAIRLALGDETILFFSDPPLTRHRRNSQNFSGNAQGYFKEEMAINRRYSKLMNRIYGPGSRRVHAGRAIARFGSKVKYLGAITRLTANVLKYSAPRSKMPLDGWIVDV
jgi:glycosyltransferase involved in cell wall biosynthesis